MGRQQPFHSFGHLIRGRAQRHGGSVEHGHPLFQEPQPFLPHERFYAAQVRADRRFTGDHGDANRAGVRDVRSSTELFRVLPHLDHTDEVPILLAEDRHRAQRAGEVIARLERTHLVVDEDPFL